MDLPRRGRTGLSLHRSWSRLGGCLQPRGLACRRESVNLDGGSAVSPSTW